MNARAGDKDNSGACVDCLRRSWLLSALSAPLDCCARDRDRLMALLGLTDEQLIAAVGGRRKHELSAQYAAFAPDRLRRWRHVQALCHHRHGYPRLLSGPAAPHHHPSPDDPGGVTWPAGQTGCRRSRRGPWWRLWEAAGQATTEWKWRAASRGGWRRAA